MRESTYRFNAEGYRKSVCTVCWSVVLKRHVEAHAKYHYLRGELSKRGGTQYSGFCDVTVVSDGSSSNIFVTKTGWVTDNPGPR